MIQIRKNTFETNSSSTHSLVVCDDSTWERFLSGELYINVASGDNAWSDRHPFTCSLPLFLTDEEYEKAVPNLKKEWQWKDSDDDDDWRGWVRMLIFKVWYLEDHEDLGDGQHKLEYFFG